MNSTETTKCRRCGRALKSVASRAAGIGPRCAAVMAATEGLSDKQADKMAQLIEDKAIVATTRKGVYNVVNEAGEVIHVTHVNGHCTCAWSQRRMTADVKVCYHVASARLLDRPVIRKAAPALAVAPAIALPSSDAMWAEIDRLTEAFMAMA